VEGDQRNRYSGKLMSKIKENVENNMPCFVVDEMGTRGNLVPSQKNDGPRCERPYCRKLETAEILQ
jgi:hypothetical protein